MRSGVTTKTREQANTSQKSLCPDPNNFLVPMDPVPTSTRLKPSWKTLKEVLDRSRLVSDWQWRYQRLKSARLQDFLALSHDCLYCTGPDWVESGGYLKYTEFRRLCHYVSSVAFMFLSSNLKTKTCETPQVRWANSPGPRPRVQRTSDRSCRGSWPQLALALPLAPLALLQQRKKPRNGRRSVKRFAQKINLQERQMGFSLGEKY